MLKNGCTTDRLEILNCCREANCPGDVRCACLEAVGRSFETAFLEHNSDNHFSTAMPWRHRIQNIGAAVKNADTSVGTHFVSGKRKEITTQLLNVDGEVSRT